MLNVLAKRKRSELDRKSEQGEITADDLRSEVASMVSEKPRVAFSLSNAIQSGNSDLGELAVRSTRLLPTFAIGVILPTVLTLIYLLAFATPQFESEESFSVQQGTRSQRSVSGVMALAAQFSGISTTSQETYMVLEYLRSANAIEDIGGRAFLEPIFSGDDIDYLSRMGSGLPLEDLLDYWESKVIPELDTRSGIITLKVRAFTAEAAYDIAQKLMAQSEKLVNKVSLRSREDTLKRVEGDVARSVALLAESRAQLLTFRNQESSIDPVKDAEQLISMMTELTLSRIQLETEIGALSTQMAGGSPALKVKREQSEALQKQINDLESQMTNISSGDDSVARKLVGFEKLKTDIMYHEKLYTASLATYEQAREDTLKQQIFIVPVVSAAPAESSDYPSTWQVTVSVLLLCSALWSIAALVIAGVKDHRI